MRASLQDAYDALSEQVRALYDQLIAAHHPWYAAQGASA